MVTIIVFDFGFGGLNITMDVAVMFFNIKYVLQRFTMSQSPLYISNLLTALEVVIYDNAYNLHKYCLNRDLWFFAGTKFRVE